MLDQLMKHRSRLIVIFVPILFSPLLIFYGTKEMRCLYTIMLMSTFWITEALPMAVTAMLPLVLYPMLGVAKAKDVTKDYMKDPLFLFIGGYMLAIAVENCNLHKRLALGTLVMVGSDIKRILASLMLSTGFLSMWANNAACTAMMLPILQAILFEIIKDNRLKASAAALSVDGENNNNVVDIENKNENPEKQAPTKLVDMDLTREEQKLCKMMLLGTCYASNIGGIATLTGTPPNIIVFGMIEASYGTHTGLTYATWMLAATPLAILNLILAWFLLQISFLGIKDTFGCGTSSTNSGNVKMIIRAHYESLGPMRYKEKVVALLFSMLILLWITRSPKVVTGWGDMFPKEYVSDSTAAILISILLFVLPAETSCASGNSSELEKVKENKKDRKAILVLSWKYLQSKFPWDMLLLIGGSFGMAEGVRRSGLADEVGGIMAKMDGFSPLAMCAVTALITTFLTEFTSNAAAVIILTPILQAAAVTLHVNPLYLLLTCTVCVSYAFMLPVATVPNAIVFGTGLIQVADMAKIGFIMNCTTVLITLLAMSTWVWSIFDFGTYPDWAPKLNSTSTDYLRTNTTIM